MDTFVPVNLSVADVHAAAGVAEVPPERPKAGDLDNWAQEAYSLDVSAATRLGFPVGNLSATFRRQALMFGSSRWKDVTAGEHSYRFGVALRALIVISDIKGEGALTLPVVAAKVELEAARASAQLLVRGYKGNKLADVLPGWQTFGVDSYAEYMKSVSDIQRLIMDDEPGIEPELLATTIPASTAPPSAAASVGAVHALHSISQGASVNEAIAKLRTDDEGVLTAVRNVYASIVGGAELTKPDDEKRQAAEQQLYGLHLGNGFFSS